jgi:hypothetical protein
VSDNIVDVLNNQQQTSARDTIVRDCRGRQHRISPFLAGPVPFDLAPDARPRAARCRSVPVDFGIAIDYVLDGGLDSFTRDALMFCDD